MPARWALWRDEGEAAAKRLFGYSIIYLFLSVRAVDPRPRADGDVMSERIMADDPDKRRRAKNLALGLAIAGLCLLFYLITIVRMGLK